MIFYDFQPAPGVRSYQWRHDHWTAMRSSWKHSCMRHKVMDQLPAPNYRWRKLLVLPEKRRIRVLGRRSWDRLKRWWSCSKRIPRCCCSGFWTSNHLSSPETNPKIRGKLPRSCLHTTSKNQWGAIGHCSIRVFVSIFSCFLWQWYSLETSATKCVGGIAEQRAAK